MRTVRDPDGLPDALAAARREAHAAFGDDRLILERLVDGARHVEIQVLFDGHGDGHPPGRARLLDPAPPPEGPRGDAVAGGRCRPARPTGRGRARRSARAVGYVSAGTCEFLLDDRGESTFLEMNTRLQVEHPVTELVTGRDLVADQLRIAAGEPLGFEPGRVRRARATRSRSACTPRTPRTASCPRPGGSRRSAGRPARAIRVDASPPPHRRGCPRPPASGAPRSARSPAGSRPRRPRRRGGPRWRGPCSRSRPESWTIPSGSPAAMRSWSATRSRPVTISVTGCSTWSRVFISRKNGSPRSSSRNSHVPALDVADRARRA